MTTFSNKAKSITAAMMSIAVLFLAGCGGHEHHAKMNDAGQTFIHGDLRIADMWVRASEPPAKTTAAYFILNNEGTTSDVLISVSTEVAEFNEIHQSLEEDGISMMRKVKNVQVPAGSTVKLEPGGYHIMMINLSGPLSAGEEIPITLTFEQAGTFEAVATVRKQGDDGHSNHDHH